MTDVYQRWFDVGSKRWYQHFCDVPTLVPTLAALSGKTVERWVDPLGLHFTKTLVSTCMFQPRLIDTPDLLRPWVPWPQPRCAPPDTNAALIRIEAACLIFERRTRPRARLNFCAVPSESLCAGGCTPASSLSPLSSSPRTPRQTFTLRTCPFVSHVLLPARCVPSTQLYTY